MRGREDVTQTVTRCIADAASLDADSIRDDMALMGKDLSLDSLAIIRMILDLQKEFPNKLKVEDIGEFGLYTVRELVDRLVAS